MKRASGDFLSAEFGSSDEEDEDYVPGDESDADDGSSEEEGEEKEEGASAAVAEEGAAAAAVQEAPGGSASAADIWAKLRARTSPSAAPPAEEKTAAAAAAPVVPPAATTTVKEVYDFAGEKVECVVSPDVPLSSVCCDDLLLLDRVEKTVTREVAERMAAEAEAKKASTAPATTTTRPSVLSKIGASPSKPKVGNGGGKLLAGVLGPKPKKMSTLDKSKLDWQSFRAKNTDGLGDSLDKAKKSGDGFLGQQAFLARADARQYELELQARRK